MHKLSIEVSKVWLQHFAWGMSLDFQITLSFPWNSSKYNYKINFFLNYMSNIEDISQNLLVYLLLFVTESFNKTSHSSFYVFCTRCWHFESVCTFHVDFLNYLCSSGLIQGTVKCFRVMHITDKHQLS